MEKKTRNKKLLNGEKISENKMCNRYNAIGRKYAQKDLDRQNFVDFAIMDLICKLNPTKEKIYFNKQIIVKVREAITEVFTKDLNICTERGFYP